MKKEKYIISRKLIGGLLLKNIIVFGVFILAAQRLCLCSLIKL